MSIVIADILGVDIRSAPVFGRDCSFPITDWIKRCPPDQVLANIPIHVGAWEDDTLAPSLSDYEDQIDTTGVSADGCDAPVVRTSIETCNMIAPNMKEIAFQTPMINWRDLRTQFCKMRKILPEQLCVFDGNGNLAMGNEYTIDFIKFALNTLARVFAKQVTRSAMIGDDANQWEFDGIYTQIDNGWRPAGTTPCDPNLNKGVVIDWSAMTGNPHGTGCAFPDDKTIAGVTINIWGEVHDVPAGITLAEFLEDLWIDKVSVDWADSRGGVDMWEMHAAWGQAKCLLNNAACLRPCNTCDFDDGVRERFAAMVNGKVVELYPSGRRFPILETRYMKKNTLRFGPRSIGGRPTYGLFFDNIDRYLNTLPDGIPGGHMGMPGDGEDFLTPATEDLIKSIFENQTVFWDVQKISAKCLRMLIMAFAGVLVCSRHLWLRIDNVCCPSFIENCDSHLSIDGVKVVVP